MRYTILTTLASIGLLASNALAQSNINPDHKFGWCENVGWTNWHDAGESEQGVVVEATFLGGFIWAENVGWLNVGDGSPENGMHYANEDGSDFGVNIDPETGDLFGLAWGENVGWINFDTRSKEEQRARFDICEKRLFGFAWGENIGWINLDDEEHFVGITFGNLGACCTGSGCTMTTEEECSGGCLRSPEWLCDGDVDGDGQVNPVDSGIVQAHFGSEQPDALCNYDVDCDGQINPVDSGIVQSLFGTCDSPRASCFGAEWFAGAVCECVDCP